MPPQPGSSSRPKLAHNVGPRLSRQIISLLSLLAESASSTSYDILQQAMGVTARPKVVPGQGVIVITGTGAGISRELALRFAALGFTVFCQTSESTLPSLIARWQDFKTRLEPSPVDPSHQSHAHPLPTKTAPYQPGHSYSPSTPSPPATPSQSSSSPSSSMYNFASAPAIQAAREQEIREAKLKPEWNPAIIPLPFNSRDPAARGEAFGTVKAWCREHGGAKIVALINCIDAAGARAKPVSSGDNRASSGSSGGSPGGGWRTRRRSSAGSMGSSLGIGPSAAGGPAPGTSVGTGASHGGNGGGYYTEVPIPLSIATDDHLNDLMQETYISMVGIVQDFLPMLKSSKGRVINLWTSGNGVGVCPLPMGPLAPAEAAFRAATKTLALELLPFNVAVSLILPGATVIARPSSLSRKERRVARRKREVVDKLWKDEPGLPVKEAEEKASLAVEREEKMREERKRATGEEEEEDVSDELEEEDALWSDPALPTVSVTNDLRSILTPESSPAIRAVFDTQVKIFQKIAWLSSFWRIDDALVFTVVRRAVEARYPRAVYPVGLDAVLASLAHRILPTNIAVMAEERIYLAQRRWIDNKRWVPLPPPLRASSFLGLSTSRRRYGRQNDEFSGVSGTVIIFFLWWAHAAIWFIDAWIRLFTFGRWSIIPA